jgi:biopolymer transport protein ExbD
MARTFRRQRQSHPIADINVTNLIDLGFTLLIIFMISTPLIDKQQQTIPVRLPFESKSQQVKPEPGDTFMAVSVDVRGRYYVNSQQTPLSLAELRTHLHAWSQEKKPPIIRIRGDGNVTYDKMIQLWDELNKANLTRITLDTQTAE